jgi:hypothetical protein
MKDLAAQSRTLAIGMQPQLPPEHRGGTANVTQVSVLSAKSDYRTVVP